MISFKVGVVHQVGMVELKAVVSYPDGKAETVKLDSQRASAFIGLKIGDKVDGGLVGKPEYVLVLAGGSDSAGFPMDKSVQGGALVRIIQRKRGTVRKILRRGAMVTESVVQLNMKAVKKVGSNE